ncbi:MAG: serine hydrolase [Alphaproteobacteria bacterium]|nr:serine hydrolase [Alphaproteobacteria bacterium]
MRDWISWSFEHAVFLFRRTSVLRLAAILLCDGRGTCRSCPVGRRAGRTESRRGARSGARSTARDALARRTLAEFGLPGLAVAVVHQGKTVVLPGLFCARSASRASPTPTTVFQIASLSKFVAVSVVAQQVSAGVVSWDTPSSGICPLVFTLSDPLVGSHVTIGDLFAHRSGFLTMRADDLETIGFSRREILERLAQLPLNAYRDSYALYQLRLTTAAEAVAAGTDRASLSEQALYAPLGMTRTSSRFEDYLARDNRALAMLMSMAPFAICSGAGPTPSRRRAGSAAPRATWRAGWPWCWPTAATRERPSSRTPRFCPPRRRRLFRPLGHR